MDQDQTPPRDSASAPAESLFVSLAVGLLLLALMALITGFVLMPSYTAVAGKAHASVAAFEASTVLRIIRAAHRWASALLLLLGATTLVYGLFTGSYRRPYHLAWVSTVALVLLFFAFQLTGHLLPWDVHAVRSTAIEAGIAANAPVVGPMQARLVRGGTDAVSPQTLRAWYTAHVALFPLAFIVLAGLFALPLRRAGHRLTPAWGPFVAALGVLILMSVAVPAPLGPPATAADYTSFASPPEWYVLPMHGLLNIVQGINPSLAFIGTMVLPGLVVLWLLALPWLDRRSLREPPSPTVRGATVLGVAAVLVLTLINVGHVAPLFTAPKQETQATPVNAVASTPLDPKLVDQGKAVYDKNGCAGCHKIGTEGGAVGPPLESTGRRHSDLDWQVRHLKNPSSVVPGSTMPPYNQLSETDLKALATYMLSLK
jgi:ubiquinol-cytochrome c reductase cytochrome b subunit